MSCVEPVSVPTRYSAKPPAGAARSPANTLQRERQVQQPSACGGGGRALPQICSTPPAAARVPLSKRLHELVAASPQASPVPERLGWACERYPHLQSTPESAPGYRGRGQVGVERPRRGSGGGGRAACTRAVAVRFLSGRGGNPREVLLWPRRICIVLRKGGLGLRLRSGRCGVMCTLGATNMGMRMRRGRVAGPRAACGRAAAERILAAVAVATRTSSCRAALPHTHVPARSFVRRHDSTPTCAKPQAEAAHAQS